MVAKISARIVRDYINCPPNLQHLPTPMGLTWLTAGLLDSGDTYTSILQFFPLNQSYAGKYTCRLGGNPRLAANTVLMVNGNYMHAQLYDYLCIILFAL